MLKSGAWRRNRCSKVGRGGEIGAQKWGVEAKQAHMYNTTGPERDGRQRQQTMKYDGHKMATGQMQRRQDETMHIQRGRDKKECIRRDRRRCSGMY